MFVFVFFLQPEQYLSHLIGHEGKGSILSELKSKGWCNSLLAGHSTAARGFGFFDIMVDLTKEGFENIDAIITIIFQVSTHISHITHRTCYQLPCIIPFAHAFTFIIHSTSTC